MTLKEQVYNYINNPLDPGTNFNTGLYYESIGQTAAALSYFLRCAELTDDKDLEYESLLKTYRCVAKQTRRPVWEKEQLMIAITHYPERPEAYFLLSQWHSAREEWTEANYFATVAQKICDFTLPSLGSDVGYVGHWGLKFQEAFACWYRGLRQHSLDLWKELYNDPQIMNSQYFQIIINNCVNFGILQNFHDPIIYNDQTKLKPEFNFKGIKKIKENYAQVFQDIFVLACLDGKKDGTYIEIGAGDPKIGNNTLLLEQLGWNGFSIDTSEKFTKKWNESDRKNLMIQQDAINLDYLKLINENLKTDNVDYLQIDLDESISSFEVLKKIPFYDVQFAVITYEHDHYIDASRKGRQKSRDLLESHGYVLVAGNISPDDKSPFEDWWVHPNLVDMGIVNDLVNNTKNILNIKDYILQ